MRHTLKPSSIFQLKKIQSTIIDVGQWPRWIEYIKGFLSLVSFYTFIEMNEIFSLDPPYLVNTQVFQTPHPILLDRLSVLNVLSSRTGWDNPIDIVRGYFSKFFKTTPEAKYNCFHRLSSSPPDQST